MITSVILQTNTSQPLTSAYYTNQTISSNSQSLNSNISGSITTDPNDGRVSIAYIAAAGGVAFLIILIIILLIIITKRRAAAMKKKIEEEAKEKNYELNDPNNPNKVIKKIGGAESLIFHNEEELNNKNDNDPTLDFTQRKFIEMESRKNPKSKNFNKVVALFSQALTDIHKKHKEMNILDEIKHMNENLKIKNDGKSSRRVETEKSHVSGASANRLAKREYLNSVINYTDGNRDEPDDIFYIQDLDEINKEKEAYEKEEQEAIIAEQAIEERLKKKLTKNKEEENRIIVGLPPNDEIINNKDILLVKDHAVMTDYSIPKNIEILKNLTQEFKK